MRNHLKMTDSSIRELLKSVDLEDLISQTVSLTKEAGKNKFGLCPFHTEKTPSFSVRKKDPDSEDPSFYYCFGCGRGGDAIRFIADLKNLDYDQSIEYLSKLQQKVVSNEN